MNSTSNSGKFIIPFSIIVIILNVFLVVFIFLNQSGFFANPNNTEEISNEEIYVSLPVSSPVSFPN